MRPYDHWHLGHLKWYWLAEPWAFPASNLLRLCRISCSICDRVYAVLSVSVSRVSAIASRQVEASNSAGLKLPFTLSHSLSPLNVLFFFLSLSCRDLLCTEQFAFLLTIKLHTSKHYDASTNRIDFILAIIIPFQT